MSSLQGTLAFHAINLRHAVISQCAMSRTSKGWLVNGDNYTPANISGVIGFGVTSGICTNVCNVHTGVGVSESVYK